jgi:hypothetical protein
LFRRLDLAARKEFIVTISRYVTERESYKIVADGM